MKIKVKDKELCDIYESTEDTELDYNIGSKSGILRIYKRSPDSKGAFRVIAAYKNYDNCKIEY